MNPGGLKNKISRIPLLWKSGMVVLVSGVLVFNVVLAQIPYEEGQVYVCPLAAKMEEINPRCPCRIDLVLGETVTSTCSVDGKTYEMTLTITEYEEKEYYAILGFENGGAGVNFPPKAKILVPSEAYVGQEILFNGSQSFDSNDDPLDFNWNFGDGNLTIGEKVSHIYQNPGEYLVTLTVFDGMVSSTATTTLKVLSPTGVPISRGFVYFEKEKGTKKEKETKEEIEKKDIEESFQKTQKITQKPKEPEKITQILKIEKPKEKPKDEKKFFPKEEQFETTIPPQNFTSLFLASLKEVIVTPKVILSLALSISILIYILVKEIRLWFKK